MENFTQTQARTLADVFNRQYQAHRDGEPWQDVMRSICEEIAFVVSPEGSAQGQQTFMDDANWSGLFTDRA